MSSVIRPAGPLPPRVYWTRRLLLVALVFVAITVVWWLFSRVTGDADETTAAVDRAQAGTSDSSPSEPEQSAPDPPSRTTDGPKRDKPKSQKARSRQPLAQPTGDCDPAEVAMRIEVKDVRSGRPNRVRLVMTSMRTPACTLAITPATLALRVTSGDDIVWSSIDCPDDVLAEEVVVRQTPPATYEFVWNGRRSIESCSAPGRAAEPGGYWVQAALIGADAYQAYFDVTAR